MRVERFMSVALAIENAWRDVAMATCRVKIA